MSEIRVDTISEKTSANGVAIDGVTIKDGGIAATAASTITTADNTDTLTLTSTDADATVGPNLRLYRNSASPADSDDIGAIRFDMRNDNSQDFTAAQITGDIGDVSDGTEDAEMHFDIMTAGTLREYLRFQSGNIIFNEGSQDIDFRVESDGRTHAFVVDAGTNTTMIGTNQTDFNAGADDLIVGTGSGDKGITIYTGSSVGDKGSIFFADGLGATDVAARRGQISYEHNNELMTFFTNDTEAMRIHLNQVISASAGIALGVGTANTASNVLDDYEEGTWTPVIKSNNNTISRSGGNEFHTYTKIGRMVNITFTLQAVTLSGTIDNSGDFTTITGLPFTSSSTAGQRSPSTEILFFTSGSKFTEGNVTGTVGVNASKVEVLEHDGAGTGYSSGRIANLTSNTYWMFNLTYYV